ncbi:excinuclease ABC subunit C [Halobacteriales archaeon QS_1_68_20]|nr:MAG: excinuclease ABC subunit C [Halobacteriales archaeon QS_1_68_20]
MDADEVRERAADLPREPGVYQFLERAGRSADGDGPDGEVVLYVGKAVDLRDRVRSYVDPRSERIARMVDRADDVDVAVTDTETQALLLEANLVKQYQPRYNVRLRDDKSYPLVQLTDHEFPRIEVTRDPVGDDPRSPGTGRGDGGGATVFGPFTDKGRVETVVKALRETYGVRGCSDHKFANRERPCLDYEMGLCTAPCVADTGIDREGYLGDVEAVERFLAGETHLLADPLREEMERAAGQQEFERAANLRDRLDAVEAFHEGGRELVADSGDERVVDVLGAAVEGRDATVARLHSEDGQLVDRTRHTLTAPEGGEDRLAAVLAAFVQQYYAERPLPDALLLPMRLDDGDVRDWLDREGVAVRVPGAGKEGRLVDLALKNASRPGGRDDELGALAETLGLDRVQRVEGFDVSHAQGTAAVGSDVTFVGGSPEKSDYRRKKLPAGNDDYANMRALVRWRAERSAGAEDGDGHDDRPDPDLLLIDGGAGQLSAAREALAGAGWSVPVVSLAKEDEVVHAPVGDLADHSAAADGDARSRTYDWPSDAPQLHVLQRVRDEAHRFAVQYHGTLRDEVSTALEDVPGVGPETRRRLLRRFGSVDAVRDASDDELRAVDGVGARTVEAIRQTL